MEGDGGEAKVDRSIGIEAEKEGGKVAAILSPRIGRGQAVATEKTGRTAVTETEAVGGSAETMAGLREGTARGTMEIVPIGAPTRANDGAFIESRLRGRVGPTSGRLKNMFGYVAGKDAAA